MTNIKSPTAGRDSLALKKENPQTIGIGRGAGQQGKSAGRYSTATLADCIRMIALRWKLDRIERRIVRLEGGRPC